MRIQMMPLKVIIIQHTQLPLLKFIIQKIILN